MVHKGQWERGTVSVCHCPISWWGGCPTAGSHVFKDGGPLKLSLFPSFPFPGRAGSAPKVLQPWLIGLTAVVVFLFVVFVMLLVNRLWKVRRHRLD